jgi:hypothetical protein
MSGIIINEDSNHFIYSRHAAGVKVSEPVLRAFISQYKNTQVTDFVINTNGMISFSPSQVRETALDKYMRYKAAGKVDESNAYCEILYDVYINQKLDMYAVWFEQCRKDGLTSWLSVRMNDCHCNNMDDHLLLSEFFLNNKQLRRVTHHNYDNYFNNCLDYGREQVRQYYMDYIDECLESYDFDGLELDWMREIFCFKPGQEHNGIAIINDFMRTVKQKVDAAANRRGHNIRLSVRLPHSPVTALNLGFDVITWIKKGLVDLIIPAPRWESIDNGMPIDFWKKLLAGTGIELAAGLELGMRPYHAAPMKSSTMEITAASALMYLSAGADKIYLFNYMDTADPEACDKCTSNDDMMPNSRKNYSALLNNFGCIETLLSLPRRHAVTYHDIEAPGIANTSILPIDVDGKSRRQTDLDGAHIPVRIETGIIPAGKNITLIIAASSDDMLSAADFSVFVNSSPVKYIGPVTVHAAYSDAPHYAFSVQNHKDFPSASIAEFATKGCRYCIEHVELRVDFP